MFDLREHGLDRGCSFLVEPFAAWCIELGDHLGGECLGTASSSDPEQLVHAGPGHTKLCSRDLGVDLAGFDASEEPRSLLVVFADPFELPGPPRRDDRLDTARVDVVNAPVAVTSIGVVFGALALVG